MNIPTCKHSCNISKIYECILICQVWIPFSVPDEDQEVCPSYLNRSLNLKRGVEAVAEAAVEAAVEELEAVEEVEEAAAPEEIFNPPFIEVLT